MLDAPTLARAVLDVPPVGGATINSVPFPPLLAALLWALLAVGTLAVYARRRARGTSPRQALGRALAVALAAAGLLWAAWGERVWTSWLAADVARFGGLTTEEKLQRLDGRLHEFVGGARGHLPSRYALLSTNPTLPLRVEYLLLPRRRDPAAEVLLVIADRAARYDAASGTYLRPGKPPIPADLIWRYSDDAFVLRRR